MQTRERHLPDRMKRHTVSFDTVTLEAIDWMVLLRSGEATPAERSAFDAWVQRDERHGAAWQRLAGPVDGAFAVVRAFNQRTSDQADTLAEVLADTAAQATRRRGMLRGALAVGGIGVGAALVAQRFMPLQDTLADLRTGTAERRSFTLADGSTLLLNARSAADVGFADGLHKVRQVHLRDGELIADARPDAQAPFTVLCRHGSVHALPSDGSTRFLLRQDGTRSLVAALQGHVALATDIRPRRLLAAGEAVWFCPAGIEAAAPGAAANAATWQAGNVAVYDQPLGDVVAALRPYRRGFLRISREAAALRVYGSYPLDDTDRALATIGETLPVVVHVHPGGWLVRIDVA